MGVNKINYNGKTLIDLTEDTVTASDLPSGVTSHSSNGERIIGNRPFNGLNANGINLTGSEYDRNTWYPVIRTAKMSILSFEHFMVNLDPSIAVEWGRENDGLCFAYEDLYAIGSGWGVTNGNLYITTYDATWLKNQVIQEFPHAFHQFQHSSTPCFYLRGGGLYTIYDQIQSGWTVATEQTNVGYDDFATPLDHNPGNDISTNYTADYHVVHQQYHVVTHTAAVSSNEELYAQCNSAHERFSWLYSNNNFVSYDFVINDITGNTDFGGGIWYITGFAADNGAGYQKATSYVYQTGEAKLREKVRSLAYGVWSNWNSDS